MSLGGDSEGNLDNARNFRREAAIEKLERARGTQAADAQIKARKVIDWRSVGIQSGKVALLAVAATLTNVGVVGAKPLHNRNVSPPTQTNVVMDLASISGFPSSTKAPVEDTPAIPVAPPPTPATAVVMEDIPVVEEAKVEKKVKKKKKKAAAPEAAKVEAEVVQAEKPKTNAELEKKANAMLKKVNAKNRKNQDLSYTKFWDMVEANQISEVLYTKDRDAVLATEKASPHEVHRVMLPFDPDLFDHMLAHGVEVDVLAPSTFDLATAGIKNSLVPILALYALVTMILRSIGEPSDDLGTPLAKKVKTSKVDTSLADIAGIDSIKEEIVELIDYLRDSSRYISMGARLPAGVLMVGPPGTGKTLLAKAIAGEAQVPFFSCAGSEFVEMFVGVGASRVRNLFAMARKSAPCIIFIDEFDALGASRTLRSGSGMMGGEESTNTINQMLTEMDGFEDNTGVVVLAATNRPAVLDEALTRPGRFDRVLHLPLPGIQGRVQILKVHARNKTIKGEVDYERIARGCAGWTGADIMNLMNESAITAIREGLEDVEERHIVDALERLKRDAISAGGQKVESAGGKNSDVDEIGPLLQTSICLHEAGRALIGHLTPNFDELQKVTVFPGGRPTGHTSFVPQESHLESGVMSQGYLQSQMVVCLAGRVAEKIVLGEEYVSTAATTHLADANLIARQMVMRFGYNKQIGPVSLMGGQDEVYLRTDRASVAMAEVSPDTAEMVLEEVIALIEEAEAKATYCLSKNKDLLVAVMEKLKVDHNMTGKQVAEMCTKFKAVSYYDVDPAEIKEGQEPTAVSAVVRRRSKELGDEQPSEWYNRPKSFYAPPAVPSRDPQIREMDFKLQTALEEKRIAEEKLAEMSSRQGGAVNYGKSADSNGKSGDSA
eukprot:CAMPEP_0198233314 /NCGR_PEP_ID=MMETSP1445-20131203/116175_1 /TAXON_ID=36898 /ORGANISM="Pyramimonas sp., Strain CCMP2087" /LENGTH=890 /DNA_ID=CAMNT_0043914005 /DNA_START=198 /DNA_END=2870 /DNA_ORIENTATION=+